MQDQLMLPAPSQLPKGARLIIIPTRDIVDGFREDMSVLQDAAYDLDEIGAVFVETFDQIHTAQHEKHWNLREAFSEHFARQQTYENEYIIAVEKYRELFDRMETAIRNVNLESMGRKDRLGISFFRWLGDDLVVVHHPLPY